MRNAGGNFSFLDRDRTCEQVCFASEIISLPPEFLIRLASLGTFSPGEGLRLRRLNQQFIFRLV